MLERSGNDHRHHELALIVGQGRVHVATDLCAAHLLAKGLVQDSCYTQVESLVGEVNQSSGCQRAAIDHGVQIVGLRHAILHVKITGQLDEIGEVLHGIKVTA